MCYSPIIRLTCVFAICTSFACNKSSSRKLTGPRIEYSPLVSIPIAKVGETVKLPFAIHNSGTELLRVGPFRSNCTCTTAKVGDETYGVAKIEPGQTLQSQILVVVRDINKQPLVNEILFETNDPNCPAGKIAAKIDRVYGLVCVPASPCIIQDKLGPAKGEFLISAGGMHQISYVSMTVHPTNAMNVTMLSTTGGDFRFEYSRKFDAPGQVEAQATLLFRSQGIDHTLEVPLMLQARDIARVIPAKLTVSIPSDKFQLSHTRVLISTSQPPDLIELIAKPDWLSVKQLSASAPSSTSVFECEIKPALTDFLPIDSMLEWKIVIAGQTKTIKIPVSVTKP
jgi:hypothetical protein